MAQRNGSDRGSEVADGHVACGSWSGVPLLTVEPELRSFVSAEQLDDAERFVLPSTTLDRGGSIIGLLQQRGAFGAVVLDGLLLQGVQIEQRPSLRLVGPGDAVPVAGSTPALPLAAVNVRAAAQTQIALLDDHFLLATRRWPWLAALAYRRAIESSERLATQIAISHLPRVEDRLMSLMWLLADEWGYVTPAGIRLRLALTHDALGQLVGAQRPTVSLALNALRQRGSLIRQDRDWVILDSPPEPSAVELEPFCVVDAPRNASVWNRSAEQPSRIERLASLRAELARLRERNASATTRAHELQDVARELRSRTHQLLNDFQALTDQQSG
jgi:CRP/FNR family transcriptional regulator, cyclic AMP receptor protein